MDVKLMMMMMMMTLKLDNKTKFCRFEMAEKFDITDAFRNVIFIM